MKKYLSVLLIFALALGALAGCHVEERPNDPKPGNPSAVENPATGKQDPVTDEENREAGGNSVPENPVDADFAKTDEDMFTKRDRRTSYDADEAIRIRLNGNSATASSNSVRISGTTIVIKEEATYVISGSLTNGRIVVDAPDDAKLQLVLNGVNIVSDTSAALYILEADKVFVTLADGSENTLANGGNFIAVDSNNIDGALFSKQDLTLNGSGSLTVTSPAGHGIVGNDDLVITGGTYTIHSASHGLDANDSVRITDADLTFDAGKDGIHCENNDDLNKGFVYISSGSITGEAEGDGISASAYMQVAGGTIDLLVGGGSQNGTKEHSDGFGGFMGGGFGGGRPGGRSGSTSRNAAAEEGGSMKGLKAAGGLLISGGSITINSADDAIHSDASVFIHGGTIAIASGDDAIHAEETLTISAGNIDISECYEGLEALHIIVRGGDIKLVATDDGLNAAGGTDQSGTSGGRDGMFGGGRAGGFGGMGVNSNGSIKISGGTLYINSSGDGMDANGTLEISGGHTTVVGPIHGDTATLDYDKTGVITGGTFIGTGSTMMAQSFSDSTQGVIALNVGSRAAGTQIVLTDASGKVIVSRTPELDFAVVILSTPEMVKGETYDISIGADSGSFEAS